MSMSRIKVSKDLRSQIVIQSLEADCDIAELARKHVVSKKSIYLWRSKYKKSIAATGVAEPAISTVKSDSDKSAEFVELSLSDQVQTGGKDLSRVDLVFTDFSLLMEGQIKSGVVLSIVKILEESC